MITFNSYLEILQLSLMRMKKFSWFLKSYLYELILLILRKPGRYGSIREGKCFGGDGIPPEVLKRCDLVEIILDFCNQALLNNKKPEQWAILNLTPVPKSGNLSNTANYRGISPSSIVAKTYNCMLLYITGYDHTLMRSLDQTNVAFGNTGLL